MNPTDEVDDLLTQAGARWRADQPSAPEPDLDRILGGRRRPRVWVPALAAASVAAIAAAALTVLPGGDKEPVAGPVTNGGPTESLARGNQAPPHDELLVRDGDRVRVGGQVIAVDGKDPVYCPSLPQPAIGWPKGEEPAPSCPPQYAVPLKGLDLNRIGDPKTIQGVRTGYVIVTGIWSGRTIEVQDQQVPQTRSTTLEREIPPDQVPCPEPPGGWRTGRTPVDQPAVAAFLDARQDQVTDPRLLYPKGDVAGAPEVYTIGVAHGDLAAFRAAFAKVYAGNLCVHQVKLSKAELTRISTAVSDLMNKDLGVYRTGPEGVDKVGVGALAYDEALKTALTPLGLENLTLDVAVKPVR